MKRCKHILIALSFVLLVLSAGCGAQDKLVELEQPQGTTQLWYYDGTAVTCKQLSQEDGAALVKQLNALKYTAQTGFDPSAAKAYPLYGLCVDQGTYNFNAAVCDGVWLDSTGGQYRVETDFASVWSAYSGEESQSDLTRFPHIRALAEGKNGWNTAFLQEAELEYSEPAGDEVVLNFREYNSAKRILRVSMENNFLTTYLTIPGQFIFHVELDGKWYDVPYATADHVIRLSDGYDVTRYLGQSFDCDLAPYGKLPAGNYRIGMVAQNMDNFAPTVTATLGLTFS